MRCLLLSASLMAVLVSMGASQWAHHGGYHIPVIGPHGVPLDTPEVQHARAAHLAALGAAGAYDAGGQYDNGRYDHQQDDRRYYGPVAYQTTHGAAKVTADGVPLETPEVAAAKAHHFSAFSEALSRAALHPGPVHHFRKRSVWSQHAAYHGPYHIPVIGPHGVPLDTPEVQHARAAHLAALAAAGHGHAGVYHDGGQYASAYAHGYNGFQGLDHEGRPLDTPEVAHAKAAHYAAFNEAAVRNGVHGHVGHAGGLLTYAIAVPHDTPEVAHAKALHLAAHAAARAGHYH